MNIGTMIKDKRIEKGMTMKKLSEIMEVSEGTISRWESGDIENIRRKKIAKLSEVLDISIYDLMGFQKPKGEPTLVRSPKKDHIPFQSDSDKRIATVMDNIKGFAPDKRERVLSTIEAIIDVEKKSK